MPPDAPQPDDVSPDRAAPPHGAWRARAQVAEAITALIAARLTIATIPLARWRGALGRQVDPSSLTKAGTLPANLDGRGLARAVDRGAARLPGETRCLARALALHAMLRRRRIGATLLIGVLPRAERGTLDDLHAWVLRRGETLIGGADTCHVPLVGFSTESPNAAMPCSGATFRSHMR